jgi:hypothetical protein
MLTISTCMVIAMAFSFSLACIPRLHESKGLEGYGYLSTFQFCAVSVPDEINCFLVPPSRRGCIFPLNACAMAAFVARSSRTICVVALHSWLMGVMGQVWSPFARDPMAQSGNFEGSIPDAKVSVAGVRIMIDQTCP